MDLLLGDYGDDNLSDNEEQEGESDQTEKKEASTGLSSLADYLHEGGEGEGDSGGENGKIRMDGVPAGRSGGSPVTPAQVSLYLLGSSSAR